MNLSEGIASTTILADDLACELSHRGLENFVVTGNRVTLFSPESDLEFVVWIFEETDTVEGACFPNGSLAECVMESSPATDGLYLLRAMVADMLDRKMSLFSECSKVGRRNGGLSEEKQVELGLIDPKPIVELDEMLAALS